MIEWRKPKYKVIKRLGHLTEIGFKIQECQKKGTPVCIDVETAGTTPKAALNPFGSWLVGVSFCFDRYEGYYIPLAHTKDGKLLEDQVTLKQFIDVLSPILIEDTVFIGHNLKFDYKMLRRSGIRLYPRFWDTMISSQLLNGNIFKSSRLKDVITNHTTISPSLVQTFEDASNFNLAEQDPNEFCVYAINDVVFCRYIYEDTKLEIDKIYGKLFYEAEMMLIPILAEMELKGIRIDVDYFKSLEAPLTDKIDKTKEYFLNKYDINVGSTQQLGKTVNRLMGDHHHRLLKLKVGKTGIISTDVETLNKIVRELKNIDASDKVAIELVDIAEKVLEIRKDGKALSTYVKRFPTICNYSYDNGLNYILNTNFRQIQNSGRLSSSPNVQNLTKDGEGKISVRRGFICRNGYKLMEHDWSGQELRIMAAISGEKRMIQAFKENPRDADLHILTAQHIFGTKNVIPEQRFTGKTLNFLIAYGGTEYAASKTLNCSTDEAANYIDEWFKIYPDVKKWKQSVEKFVKYHGYSETLYGRRRYLSPGIYPDMDENWKWRGAIRELTNHTIQGTGADLLKFAMVNVTKEFAKKSLDANVLTATHDSITTEAEESIIQVCDNIIVNVMEVKLKGILFPVDCEVKESFSKVA